MQKKNLRYRLILVIATVFVLPSLTVCYIFYEQQILLSPSHFILFLLGLVLIVVGVASVSIVFRSISRCLELLKVALEKGENASLHVHQESAELSEISGVFNQLMERLEKTTAGLARTREALLDNEKAYRNILSDIAEGYYEVDLAGGFTYVNTSLAQILGYSQEDMQTITNRDCMTGEQAKKAFHAFNQVYRTALANKSWKGELIGKEGNIVFVEASISLMRDPSGQAVGFRGIVHDITERIRREEEMMALSIRDSLTGLYNRRGFFSLAEQQLKVAERTRKGLSLFYLDIDEMKAINDRCGHVRGDEALMDAAGVLRDVFRESDIIARIGGDEFIVLTLDTSPDFFHVFLSRLRDQLTMRNASGKRDYTLSMSVGMSYGDPSSPLLLHELIQEADMLMYEDKKVRSVAVVH